MNSKLFVSIVMLLGSIFMFLISETFFGILTLYFCVMCLIMNRKPKFGMIGICVFVPILIPWVISNINIMNKNVLKKS